MLNRIYAIFLFLNNKKELNRVARWINSGAYHAFSLIINLLMPVIYKFFKQKDTIVSNKKNTDKVKIIVSLTSFPARINDVWLCIESLLRQTIKPDVIILWLAESQFDGKDSLPNKLLEQENRGLVIRFCDDLRSHKKYYYSFKEYPDDIIITVDDDVFYPEFTLERLVELHKKYPDYICCNRGHCISFDKEGELLPYRKWIVNKSCNANPNKLICPTGVGGVLYPPNVMHSEVFNEESIKNLCFFADDLWLKIMSLLKGIKVVKTRNFPDPLFTIRSSQVESLGKSNVIDGKNDEQLKAILDYYDIDLIELTGK